MREVIREHIWYDVRLSVFEETCTTWRDIVRDELSRVRRSALASVTTYTSDWSQGAAAIVASGLDAIIHGRNHIVAVAKDACIASPIAGLTRALVTCCPGIRVTIVTRPCLLTHALMGDELDDLENVDVIGPQHGCAACVMGHLVFVDSRFLSELRASELRRSMRSGAGSNGLLILHYFGTEDEMGLGILSDEALPISVPAFRYN